MAPKGGRGGGGGGGGRSGSGSGISCDGPSFETTHSKVLIAFGVIFFLTYLVLTCMVPGRKKRTVLNNGQPPPGNVKWAFLRLSIFTAFLGMILFVSSLGLSQCGGDSEAISNIGITRIWFDAISLILLFGIILIPLCKNLHDVSGSLVPKLVAIGHSVYFAFLALLDLIVVIVLTAYYVIGQSGSVSALRSLKTLRTASMGLTATFNVFSLLGMGLAAGSMLLAVLRSSALKQGKLLLWVFILIGSSISLTLVVFAIHLHLTVLKNDLSTEADIAYFVLRYLLFAIMFTAVLYIMKNPVVLSGGAAPTAAPIIVTPQQQPLMGYSELPHKNNGYAPQVNTAYSPQYQPSPSPVPHTSPMPAYNAPYNGNNVSYAPVSSAPPAQNTYYH